MSYDVLQSVARALDVVLTAQSNGIDPVLGVVASDVVVNYSKEGDAADNLYSAVGVWVELGAGVYRITFTSGVLNTLGSFTYSVVLAGAYACVPFIPYYGHVEVVTGTVTTLTTDASDIENKVDTAILDIGTVDAKMDVVSGDISGIANDILVIDGKVDDLNNYQVGLGAHYDEDSTTLIASLVLHKNGSPVYSPISSTLVVYDENGSLLLTDTSVTPDAQGVFRFEETVVLASKSVPYVSGVIIDSDGIHATLTLTPVVG